jgi:hypothetical protein
MEIREVAAGVRKVLQLNGARIDMLDLLENRLDRRGIRYHYAPDEELGDDVARWIPSEGRIVIAVSAYESLCANEAEHMLLIPHELGHAILGHEVSFSYAGMEIDHPLNEDSEWQADVFALEFTMPREIVCRLCASISDIIDVFGVRRQDALARVWMLRTERAITW